MRTASLGDLARIVSGSTPKTGEPGFWGGDIPWVTPADLSRLEGTEISRTDRTLTKVGLDSCSATIVPSGSVLLTSRAPIGYVAINQVPMATNQGFKTLVPGPALHNRYLLHWLKAHAVLLQSLGNGATFKELSKRTVERLQVELPSVGEQRRIAAILDQADALRAKRRQVLDHLDTLTQSIFHDMFGDPAHYTQRTELGKVADLTSGKSLVGSEDMPGHPRVLKISAVTSGRFRLEETKPLPAGYIPPRSHLVRRGDLLMSRANTAALVGAVAFVEDEPGAVALPDKIWKFLWTDAESVPEFYAALLRHPTTRREISGLASGSGGSMKNISKAKLASMLIPSVATSEQRVFLRRIREIAPAFQRSSESLVAADTLFASLQSRAFRGEL